MGELLFIIYLAAGYWAAGVVLYENKVVIHTFGGLFMQKMIWGIVLGVILIPAAIIKRLLFKR